MNIKKGKVFEKKAIEIISNMGMEPLHINWRAGHKEIDIIAVKSNIIHFIEVKSLHAQSVCYNKSIANYVVEKTLSAKKLKNISEAAELYMQSSSQDFQIDLIVFYKDSFTFIENISL